MRRPLRANIACALVVLAGCCALAGAAHADQQRDPELKALLQKIVGSSDCFADKFESEVWYKVMEPRLARLVPTHEARVDILDHVYCEAKRDPSLQLPPDLVLALIEVESRFDRWAVSPAGAVGLMQVMPFWPRELGVQNQLVRVAPNIRMGCEILRYYLRAENRNWSRALARYNGSAGRSTYPALVMRRWQRVWRF
ncbi:MAG TPA: transglycosylase SLT domain-containing protein [Steroidobacteraceae bacterium]|nr:transglycosylase SLT domain-containing protein [Steroidobacteraceae bacterium]